MNLFKRRIPAIVVGSAMVGLLVTACGGEEDAPSEIDEIGDAFSSAVKLEAELQNVKNRLIIDCMAEAGFDVHPQDLTEDFSEHINEEYSLLVGSEAPGLWEMPSVEEAKERGLDVGRYNDPDFDWDAYEEEEGVHGYDPEDDPYWEMNEKYHEEYDQARYGEEYLDTLNAGDYPEAEEEWPAEGGCTGDVNDAVAQAAGVGVEELGWPEGLQDWEGQVEAYQTEALLDAQDAWSSCVEDRGHPFFEFEDGTVDVWSYVDSFYADSGMESEEKYDLPPGAPWEFEEAYQKEIELAVDIAECADETGVRETMQTEWDAVMEKVAMDSKDEIFAWHDRLEDALASAQSLLNE